MRRKLLTAAVLVLGTGQAWAGGYKAMAKEFSSGARREAVERVAVLPFLPTDASAPADGWNLSERLITQLQDALAQVKKLSGLLPICAACKKIRDDSGYWNQIEAYLREHSQAEFTHSICPDCLEKLYGDE